MPMSAASAAGGYIEMMFLQQMAATLYGGARTRHTDPTLWRTRCRFHRRKPPIEVSTSPSTTSGFTATPAAIIVEAARAAQRCRDTHRL